MFLFGIGTATEKSVRASTKMIKYFDGPYSYPTPRSAIHISLLAKGSFFLPKVCRFMFLSLVELHTRHEETIRFSFVMSPGR